MPYALADSPDTTEAGSRYTLYLILVAQAELAVSITLVNEQIQARRRGQLYSIVQGG